MLASYMNGLGINLKNIIQCVIEKIGGKYYNKSEKSICLLADLETSIVKQYQNKIVK
jgi:hypothetical protein